MALRTQHLGCVVLRAVEPDAVQIEPSRVRAVVAERVPVGVHAEHQVHRGALAQIVGDLVLGVEQAQRDAFHEPPGHALARVLLTHDPELALPAAEAE